jgi:hypothetical protein
MAVGIVDHRFAHAFEKALERVRADGGTAFPLVRSATTTLSARLEQAGVAGPATAPTAGPELDAAVDAAVASSRVVAAVTTSAWVQEVLRVFASVTNLSVAHTRVVVSGSDTIAVDLARELQRIGARVVVTGDDPVQLLALSLDGLHVAVDPSAAPSDSVVVFSTRLRDRHFDASAIAGAGAVVVVDAALPGEPRSVASTPLDADPDSRPHLAPVTGLTRQTFLLDVAAARGDGFDATVDDIRSAFALLLLAEQVRVGSAETTITAASFSAESVALADAALAAVVLG